MAYPPPVNDLHFVNGLGIAFNQIVVVDCTIYCTRLGFAGLRRPETQTRLQTNIRLSVLEHTALRHKIIF